VIDTLNLIMKNTQKEFTGIWYPNDLNDFFSKKEETMPEEYLTGYASRDYFNKKKIALIFN